jgi:hypothetical protein
VTDDDLVEVHVARTERPARDADLDGASARDDGIDATGYLRFWTSSQAPLKCALRKTNNMNPVWLNQLSRMEWPQDRPGLVRGSRSGDTCRCRVESCCSFQFPLDKERGVMLDGKRVFDLYKD